MEPDQELQDKALAALPLACQHPAFIDQPGTLLAAASTCKALRQAVQQYSGCRMAVVLQFNAPLSRLRSFAQWLPKHTGLVKSLCITAEEPAPAQVDGLNWEGHLEAGLLLLQEAVQRAAAQPAAVAAAAAAAADLALPQSQPQPQHGLRIDSFSSNWRGSLDLLGALPVHSLTRLQLDLGWPLVKNEDGFILDSIDSYKLDWAVASAALARLRSLQQLTLVNTDLMCWNPGSCLAAAAELTQLTLLDLVACDLNVVGGGSEGAGWQLPRMPAVVSGLPQLRVLRLPTGMDAWPPLDFSHMTQLQELDNNGSTDKHHPFTEVQLPGQLRQVDFGKIRELHQLAAVADLQQLQRLTYLSQLGWPDETGEEQRGMLQLLLRLAQLPALQHISMRCRFACWAVPAAVGWAQLPQLCELHVRLLDSLVKEEQRDAILKGCAAATSLTKLDFSIPAVKRSTATDEEGMEGPGEAVEACSALAGLTRLSDLSVSVPHMGPGDALALTALTGLTRLVLAGAGDGVGEEAAAALVRSCHKLRHLDLSRCSLLSDACLAQIGRLKQLTELRLEGNEGITQQGLMQLTRMGLLQQLGAALEG